MEQKQVVVPGSWIKGSILGAGSFGTVSLAVRRADAFLFAVKSVEAGRSSELQALENEIDILSSIDSVHVVRCLGSELSATAANAFLEYMPGGSLADLTTKLGGKLDESLVRVYTRGIAQGLDFLHSSGIVHCDIKAKNVLVGASGEVKLADFGSAKRSGGYDDGEMKGTPLWMAPEVVRQEEQGTASDIWSLGCTLIELLTGSAPWGGSGSGSFATLYKIACSDETPELPAGISSAAKDFLSRCLQRNPALRPTAAELLAHPFVSQPEPEKHSASEHKEEEEPSSPKSTLDFFKWASSFSSAESKLPRLMTSSSSSSSGMGSPSSSPKWIVVRSPQGPSVSAFQGLSDFDLPPTVDEAEEAEEEQEQGMISTVHSPSPAKNSEPQPSSEAEFEAAEKNPQQPIDQPTELVTRAAEAAAQTPLLGLGQQR